MGGAACTAENFRKSEPTQNDDTQQDIVNKKDCNSGIIGRVYTSKPYTSSEHHRTKQQNDADASIWIKCSHSIYSNPITISDNVIVVFPEGRDISLYYTYDSNTDTFCKWAAQHLSTKERLLAASMDRLNNVLYIITASSKSPTAKLMNSDIIKFDFNLMKWHRIYNHKNPGSVSTNFGGELCKNVLGSVIIDRQLYILCNGGHFIWNMDNNTFAEQVMWNLFSDNIINMEDVNVFYRKSSNELWIKNVSDLYKYDVCSNIMSQVVLTKENFSSFGALKEFGCLMTCNERYLVILGDSHDAIYVIDMITCKTRASKVKCPKNGKTGFYACLMGNDDTMSIATEGYIRQCWNSQEFIGIRCPSLDVINMIKSFYGTWYIHLFARNGGYHWAMRPGPILDK